jgi:hypothetical protein
MAALALVGLTMGLHRLSAASTPPAGQLQVSVDRPAAYEVDPPTEWGPSETFTYAVTVENRGDLAWESEGRRRVRISVSFGGRDDDPRTFLVEHRFDLPRDMEPGEAETLQIRVTGPSQPGPYVMRHGLMAEPDRWFTDLVRADVVVGSGWPVVIVLGLVVVAVLGATSWYVARATGRSRP